MQRAIRASILAILTGLGGAACTVPSPCDPGWTHDHGTCTPPPAPPPPGPDSGAGDGDGDEDAGDESDAEVDAATGEPTIQFICPAGGDRSIFERSCVTHDDCDCPASICLPAPFNHCSGTQCTEPGKECPEGMSCIDLAPVRDQASIDVPDEVTHICL